MSKFLIQCPSCHRYAEAATGFFAKKNIRCACGYTIHVKTDKMTVRRCSTCSNDVVYDQSKGADALCPVCHSQLVTDESFKNFVEMNCPTCGCSLHVNKAAATYTCPVCDTDIDIQKAVALQVARNNGLPAVIQYEGNNTTLVWKHPLTDFPMGSQLIVHESQEAIFFKNGEALDSFASGRYDLETGVLPIAEKNKKLPINGQPFHAEVYFVNLVTLMNIKWGTNSKVGLFDPVSGIHVELGACGSFNLRVTEPRRLLLRLVGTTDHLTRQQLFEGDTGYFRTLIMTKAKTNLATIIKENHISILEIDSHLDMISKQMQTAINAELAEYGLIIPEFYVTNVLLPLDDPNFIRLRQQHADLYLKTREEEILKAEAEKAFERKAVEAQTAARLKIIGAQGDAEVERLKGQASADVYRMQAEAEAQEMRMKGYTYQQETQRQIGLEALRNQGGSINIGGGSAGGSMTGMMADMMGLGIGLNAMSGIVGMTKDAMNPILDTARDAMTVCGWDCSCGKKGVQSPFCPSCGQKKPDAPIGWNCSCGQMNIGSPFCPNCGSKKPEPGWNCTCGQSGILSNFCPNCGSKKPE